MAPDERRRIVRRLGIVGAIFVVLLVAGTLAFDALGGEGGEEAFYRTLGSFTTASLVPEPGTSAERAISAGLAVAGGLFYLFLIGSVVGVLARRLVSEEYGGRRRRRRLSDMRETGGHYIVCGYGRVGRATAAALQEAGKSVVVIERKPENVAEAERSGALGVVGEASDIDKLLEAGIMSAAGLVACVGTDAENLYILLAARKKRENISLAARATDDVAAQRLQENVTGLRVTTPYASAGGDLADRVCVAPPADASTTSGARALIEP